MTARSMTWLLWFALIVAGTILTTIGHRGDTNFYVGNYLYGASLGVIAASVVYDAKGNNK